MIRRFVLHLLAILAIGSGAYAAGWKTERQPRYVIFMMGDGMGVDELEVARQYSLAVLGHDLFLTGTLAREGFCALMDTYSTNNLVTDSAAAATAWATGRKVKNGQIAVDPSSEAPIQTILEFLKEKHGFRTGIVTNDDITGASPAAFAAHGDDRRDAQEFARQYCDQSQPEVILGGGRRDFAASRRWDGRDLIKDFVTLHGYRYVETAGELDKVQSGRILGLFSDNPLTWHIDRPPEGTNEPMTSEMTEAALRILSADRPKGFFLFVEECVPDKAGHKSDAAAMVLGVLELDRAVAAAYRFYRRHPAETLLMVTADHETGGMQWVMGYDWEEKIRAAERREGERSPVARLASVHASIGKAVAGLQENLTLEQRARLRWRYREFQFDPPIAQALEEGRATLGKMGEKWDSVLTFLVARNTGAYYSGGQHSSTAVPLFAIGVGAERFSGHLNNTDVGQTLFRLAGRQDFRATTTSAPATVSRGTSSRAQTSVARSYSSTEEPADTSPGGIYSGQERSKNRGASTTKGSRKSRPTVQPARPTTRPEQ
jgi:alkaline phosphatase